jgi:hypothetical protein
MALVRIDVLEDGITSIIRVKRISELGTTLTVTSNRNTLLVTVNICGVIQKFPKFEFYA